MTVAVTEINAVYAFAASASVSAIAVDSELVTQFCQYHRAFRRTAGANAGDERLDELVQMSFRLWYRILSAPLPLCHPRLLDAEAADLLFRRVRAAGQSYSELREVSDRYLSALAALRSSDDNPLWRALEADLAKRQVDNVGLLIKPGLVSAVRELAAEQWRRLDVLIESQLRHAKVFDSLYVFGAGRWYPGFVFSAPRASEVRIVRYGVMRDSLPEEAVFVKPLKQPTRTLFPPSPSHGTDGSLLIGADEVRPVLDIASIRNSSPCACSRSPGPSSRRSTTCRSSPRPSPAPGRPPPRTIA